MISPAATRACDVARLSHKGRYNTLCRPWLSVWSEIDIPSNPPELMRELAVWLDNVETVDQFVYLA